MAPPPGRRAIRPVLRQGDLLAGRYRLDHAVEPAPRQNEDEESPAIVWRAQDEVLARPVALKVLRAAGRRGAADAKPFLEAAAAAGSLSSPLLARVYDAAIEEWPAERAGRPAGEVDVAYVISEWVDGRALPEVLAADGPYEPAQACALVVELAEALQSAHDRGVWHGRVHPGNVMVTAAGRLKLTDTATSTALPERAVPAGRAGDPVGAAADVRDLTAVLYAMLTARWPASATPQPSCGVPAAPTAPDGRRRGRLTSPRQVRAGVPRQLDELVQQILTRADTPSGPQTAAGLADALDAALPVPRPARRGRRRGARRAIAALVGVVVVVLLAGGGWRVGGGDVLAAVGLDDLLSSDPRSTGPAPSPVPSPSVPVVVAPVAVTDFDPPPGSGTESSEQVRNAVDADPATVWPTERYRSAAFGGLKSGVGLLVDLGAPTGLSSVQLTTLPGTTVELRAADARGASAPDYRALTRGTATGPSMTLTPPAGSTARWYLLWITGLPAVDGAFASHVGDLRLLR